MVNQLGTKMGEWLYKQDKIEKKQIDLIRYSFEIICSEITENIIIFGYGILSHKLLYTLMYLIIFHILRHYYQGYHAKTISRCLILTVSAYLAAMCVFTYITYYWGLLFLIISLVLQIEYCMKKHHFMPMAISILLKFIMLIICISTQNIRIIQLLLITELIVSISTFFGKEEK